MPLLASKVETPTSLLEKAMLPPYPIATLLNASRAVTVNEKPVPAVALAGARTEKCVAAPALVVIAPLCPVMLAVILSLAVNVWLPSAVSVPLNVPTPWLRVLMAGTIAPALLLEKTTEPA